MEPEKLTPEILKARFEPTNYTKPEELKIEIDKAAVASVKEAPEKYDPKSKNPYTFHFDWKDARGKAWQGTFVTHFPTPNDLLKAGVAQARLLQGMTRDSLDTYTEEIAFMYSRLLFCLDEKPDWFGNPMDMIDGVPLLQAVYAEVFSFEQFFREHGKVEIASKAKR